MNSSPRYGALIEPRPAAAQKPQPQKPATSPAAVKPHPSARLRSAGRLDRSHETTRTGRAARSGARSYGGISVVGSRAGGAGMGARPYIRGTVGSPGGSHGSDGGCIAPPPFSATAEGSRAGG